MAQGSARIDGPEVLKDFRNHLIKFNEHCRHSIAGVKADVYHIQTWLRGEQLNHWKRELQKAEERVLQARHAYNEARFGTPSMRKPSYLDEQKALRKAEQRREDARHTIEKIKKWASILDQQAEKLMGPVNQLSLLLDTQTPQAIATLDSKIVSLEEYLRTAPPGA